MTITKLSPLTTSSIALTSMLSLTACPSDPGTGLDSIGSAEQGTESASASNSNGNGPGDGDGDGDPGDGDGDADPTDDGGTTKCDFASIGDIGSGGQGSRGPGSCRSSELYGASGGFPDYVDPNYAKFLDRTIAIVTHNQHDGGNPNLITIVDISGAPPPPNMNDLAPLYWDPNWTAAGLGGQVFGLTLDSYGNIYVAPTTVWGANPNPSTIKRIDAVTGDISNFATLPNDGPAMGNINYDCVSETIYVSNHEDGRIYQLDMDGSVKSTYHHGSGNVTMGPANDPGEPDGVFAPLGERTWAVQSHAGRLYYSVWVEHLQAIDPNDANSVWSVAYVDDNGVPDPATAKQEFELPAVGGNNSMPVSDISFARDGSMLVAQRTMSGDTQTSAHQSTTFEYGYQDGDWIWQGTTYVVGELLPYSAAGGVDHDFDPNGYVWMTGDVLDFYTPDCVYGLQGTPYGGGGIEVSTLIDLDHEITGEDKTVYGDVELPIPGDVSPVPPPG